MQSVEQALSFEHDAGSTVIADPSSDGRLGLTPIWVADKSWTWQLFSVFIVKIDKVPPIPSEIQKWDAKMLLEGFLSDCYCHPSHKCAWEGSDEVILKG